MILDNQTLIFNSKALNLQHTPCSSQVSGKGGSRGWGVAVCIAFQFLRVCDAREKVVADYSVQSVRKDRVLEKGEREEQVYKGQGGPGFKIEGRIECRCVIE
jgi:hypothetical protein